MRLLDGYELIELTEDKIIQQKRIGESGFIRVTGNPNPPEEEQQECINKVAEILLKEHRKSQREARSIEGA